MPSKSKVKICPACHLPAIKGRKPLEMPDEKKVAPSEKDEINGDKRLLTKIVHKRIRTLAELVEVCGIDISEWEIERYVVNKWEQAGIPRSTRDSGNEHWVRPSTKPMVTQLFQVKAWMKLRKHIITAKVEIEALRKKADAFSPKYPALIFRNLKQTGNLAEFSIQDHHFGSLIWGGETGFASYDTAIAKKTYEEALITLIGRVKGYGLDKAVIIFGSDQMNFDSQLGATTAGTPQSNDSRYQKVFGVSRDVSIWAVEALCSIVPSVEVVVVPGNHDMLSSWHLGDSLSSWFRNNKNVTINNEPTSRKYLVHGNNLLMFTHGNKGKAENYANIIAFERPREWANATASREIHTGHFHHKRVLELCGATVRVLPSLRPPCAWSSENMLIGSTRSAEAFVFNDQEGLIGTGMYSIFDRQLCPKN